MERRDLHVISVAERTAIILRGCEEIARRKVGVTVSNAGMETVGAHG